MSKIILSKSFINNSVKLDLKEDLYPGGDITSNLIKDKKVKIHNVEKMWGLGTPEDLNNFLRTIK